MIDALKKLVKKWRQAAASMREGAPVTLRSCADDLEAVITRNGWNKGEPPEGFYKVLAWVPSRGPVVLNYSGTSWFGDRVSGTWTDSWRWVPIPSRPEE